MNLKEISTLFTNASNEIRNIEGLKYLNDNGLFLNEFDNLDSNSIPPNYSDLARLHKLVRERKVFTILEFGVGWSSLVLADALYKNKIDFESEPQNSSLIKDDMFNLFSLDTSQHWIDIAKKRIFDYLLPYVNFKFSEVEIGEWNGKICHFYNKIPDILPDFIYLDGPDPKDVKGEIRGLTFGKNDRFVLSADLLLMEPLLLPHTLILVDGRVSNSRFLKTNFSRNWQMEYNEITDISVFELIEDSIGKRNDTKIKYQLGK